MAVSVLFSLFPTPGSASRSQCPTANPYDFDPNEIVKDAQVSSTFARHTSRTPPSTFPGVDIYVPDRMSRLHELKSDVQGEVVNVGGRDGGTVAIRDRNGYVHVYLHNQLREDSPKLGEQVTRGQTIANMSNRVAPGNPPVNPHGHKTIFLERDGLRRYFDPEKVRRDDTGAVSDTFGSVTVYSVPDYVTGEALKRAAQSEARERGEGDWQEYWRRHLVERVIEAIDRVGRTRAGGIQSDIDPNKFNNVG